MTGRVRGALPAILVASSIAACASTPAGWDVTALERRHPPVAGVSGHRLEHALPYFALAEDGLALFLCRWSTAEPIPVWLSPRAPAERLLVLERALAAWEGAGLGVRFQSRTWTDRPPLSGIVIELLEPEAIASVEAANTVADCGIPQEAPSAGEAPIDAALQYASIHLYSDRPDALGRFVPLTAEELLGAAIHELGHALGFAGHVDRGGSVMSAHGQLDATRRWGRRVDRGEPLDEPSLAALYAAPSGVRVGRLPLARAQLDPLRELSAVATHAGLRGPFSRVGDRSARLLWRDVPGASVAVIVLDWPQVLLEPARLEPRLNRSARLLVSAASGR